jgi:endonuclease YncB( thermonuclease family)
VRVEAHGLDRYHRTIGTVFVGKLNVNAEQVRLGFAWVYRRYARDSALFLLENEAHDSRRGLWVDADPVPPWDWRKEHH